MADLKVEQCGFRGEGAARAILFALRGSLDAATIETFREQIAGFESTDPPHVLLDLSGLTYLNSSGLGELLRFSDLLKKKNVRTILVRVAPKALTVIEMLGFNGLLILADDEAQALRILAGQEPPPKPASGCSMSLVLLALCIAWWTCELS